MKSKKTLLFISILGFFGMGLFLFLRPSTATSIPLLDTADTYLLTSKRSYAFDTRKQTFNLLEKTNKPVAEFVYTYYLRATFDNRYLVFSKGRDANYPTGIVSIDFQTGQVKTTPTDHSVSACAGQSRDYFYTFRTEIDGTEISQFNVKGEEIKTRLLPKHSVMPRFSSDSKGHVYIGNVNDQNGNFTSSLLKIDEQDLSLIEEIPLQTTDESQLRFNDSIVLADTLYLPLHSIRDNATKLISASNQLLIKDLKTGEERSVALHEYYPHRMTQQGDYLLIEHDSYELGRVGFSIFHIPSEESYFVDVSDLLDPELDPSTSSLDCFSMTSDGQLFFTVNQKAIAFDTAQRKLVASFELEDDESAFYIWTTRVH